MLNLDNLNGAELTTWENEELFLSAEQHILKHQLHLDTQSIGIDEYSVLITFLSLLLVAMSGKIFRRDYRGSFTRLHTPDSIGFEEPSTTDFHGFLMKYVDTIHTKFSGTGSLTKNCKRLKHMLSARESDN